MRIGGIVNSLSSGVSVVRLDTFGAIVMAVLAAPSKFNLIRNQANNELEDGQPMLGIVCHGAVPRKTNLTPFVRWRITTDVPCC